MWRGALSLLLASCGPVVLGEEQSQRDAGVRPVDAALANDASRASDGSAPLFVSVRIKPVDCGACYELQALASGGLPPYDFEWEDGSLRPQRSVCVADTGRALFVVARDAAGSRSAPAALNLEDVRDAGCPQPAPPSAPAPSGMVCLENPSFDGTPEPNLGQEQVFDAEPWSTCTNPAETNTPDIGNDEIAQTPGVPKPTDGPTFLGLAEGEQVSQAFCSPIRDGVPVSLELDLSRVNLNLVAPETERVFLEIWGGLAVDCSRRELLWASEALRPGWKHFCVTLRPRAFMTQLTLRANTDMSSPAVAYLIVDHLKPVASCP